MPGDQAPTITAQCEGFDLLTESGKAHYVHCPVGAELVLKTDQRDVNVHSTCCGVQMGMLDPASAMVIRKWEAKGFSYKGKVKSAADTIEAGGSLGIWKKMRVLCTPTQMSSTKKEAEVKAPDPVVTFKKKTPEKVDG